MKVASKINRLLFIIKKNSKIIHNNLIHHILKPNLKP